MRHARVGVNLVLVMIEVGVDIVVVVVVVNLKVRIGIKVGRHLGEDARQSGNLRRDGGRILHIHFAAQPIVLTVHGQLKERFGFDVCRRPRVVVAVVRSLAGT